MSNLERTVIYINIIVEDASLAAQTKMMAKIDKCKAPIPQQFKDAAKHLGGKAASKLATPSAIASKMSQKLPKKMPVEMASKGLTAEVETVFVEGPYLVVQLQVQKLDSQMMAEIKAEEKSSEWGMIRLFFLGLFMWFLQKIGGSTYQKSLDEEFLPTVVQKKMEPLLNEMLKVKMEEEMKLDAETVVLGEDKQARFFFNKLKEIRGKSK